MGLVFYVYLIFWLTSKNLVLFC